MSVEHLNAWSIESTCLGVDADGMGIRVVRAVRRGPWRRWVPVDPAAAQAEGRRHPIPIAAGLSPRECLTRWVTVPLAVAHKARRVLPSLLDVDLPFPLEGCEWGVAAWERGESQTHRGLAVAARRVDVTRRIEELKQAGFEPDLLDAESLALWTQAATECGPASGWRIVAHLGSDRLTCVMGRDARWFSAYVTQQPEGGILINGLKSVLGDSGEPVEWIWTGPGLAPGGALRPARPVLEAVFPGRSREVEQPAYFLARALAFRALSPSRYPCNLRAGGLMSEPHRRRHHRRRLRAALGLAAGAALLFAANGYWRLGMVRADQALQRRITAEAGELVGRSVAREKGQEIRLAERAIQSRRESEAYFDRAFQPGATEALQGFLKASGAGEVAIEEAVWEGDALTVRGVAPDAEACERWVRALREAGFPGSWERREGGGSGRLAFLFKGEPRP